MNPARAEIWTVAGGSDYAGKPRPAVIVQDNTFSGTDSVTICLFTTNEADGPLLRLAVEPTDRNGLRIACRLMVDKVTTVSRTKLGQKIGELSADDMARLNQSLIVFLGLATI